MQPVKLLPTVTRFRTTSKPYHDTVQLTQPNRHHDCKDSPPSLSISRSNTHPMQHCIFERNFGFLVAAMEICARVGLHGSPSSREGSCPFTHTKPTHHIFKGNRSHHPHWNSLLSIANPHAKPWCSFHIQSDVYQRQPQEHRSCEHCQPTARPQV